MDADDGRAVGQPRPAGLIEPVVAPPDRLDHVRRRAGATLVHERDAVREPEQLHRPLRRDLAAVGDAGLDDERVAAVDLGIAGRGRVEVSVVLLPKPGFDQLGRDRREAVGRRCENVGRPHRFEQVGRGVAVARDRRYFRGVVRDRSRPRPERLDDVLAGSLAERHVVLLGDERGGVRDEAFEVVASDPERVAVEVLEPARERFGHRPHRGVVLPGRGGVVD